MILAEQELVVIGYDITPYYLFEGIDLRGVDEYVGLHSLVHVIIDLCDIVTMSHQYFISDRRL
jgi:hypothetical protein